MPDIDTAWIREQLEAGRSEFEIRNILLNRGYNYIVIENMMEDAKQQQEQHENSRIPEIDENSRHNLKLLLIASAAILLLFSFGYLSLSLAGVFGSGDTSSFDNRDLNSLIGQIDDSYSVSYDVTGDSGNDMELTIQQSGPWIKKTLAISGTQEQTVEFYQHTDSTISFFCGDTLGSIDAQQGTTGEECTLTSFYLLIMPLLMATPQGLSDDMDTVQASYSRKQTWQDRTCSVFETRFQLTDLYEEVITEQADGQTNNTAVQATMCVDHAKGFITELTMQGGTALGGRTGEQISLNATAYSDSADPIEPPQEIIMDASCSGDSRLDILSLTEVQDATISINGNNATRTLPSKERTSITLDSSSLKQGLNTFTIYAPDDTVTTSCYSYDNGG